jgi:starvation-inducible DNA-binding protein
LFRLLQAHDLIVGESREATHAAAVDGDDGTNDLLVSDVIRRNELQVGFVSGQLAGAGLGDRGEEAASSPVRAHAK